MLETHLCPAEHKKGITPLSPVIRLTWENLPSPRVPMTLPVLKVKNPTSQEPSHSPGNLGCWSPYTV